MPKKAVMIIAPQMFRDEEYLEPKKVLQNAGINVTTASSRSGIATGKLGLKADIDALIKDIKVKDYDAVLFIGGPGSFDYYDDPVAQNIAREAVKEGKILGAICAAPGILARAGVLAGKKATMFEDTGELKKGGAVYTGRGVEIDGKIITATGPQTAGAWGAAILKAIGGKVDR